MICFLNYIIKQKLKKKNEFASWLSRFIMKLSLLSYDIKKILTDNYLNK